MPTGHGKADLRIYKEAGQRVVEVLKAFADVVEKRSVDEVALDVTRKASALLDELGERGVVEEALAASHLADSEHSKTMSKVSHSASSLSLFDGVFCETRTHEQRRTSGSPSSHI